MESASWGQIITDSVWIYSSWIVNLSNSHTCLATYLGERQHLVAIKGENIKQALINNGFPKYIVDEQIKNVYQQNKHCSTPPIQQTFIKHFYRN